MKIGELAKRTGVSASALRYYERCGGTGAIPISDEKKFAFLERDGDCLP